MPLDLQGPIHSGYILEKTAFIAISFTGVRELYLLLIVLAIIHQKEPELVLKSKI